MSLVPHLEALASPNLIERATQKPTPICRYSRHAYASQRKQPTRYLHIHKASTVALFFNCDLKLPDLKVSRTKRKVNAFNMSRPHPPHSPMLTHPENELGEASAKKHHSTLSLQIFPPIFSKLKTALSFKISLLT